MRNLIYVFFLIVSSNIFAQSSIEQDELFLKYEQEYLNSSRAQLGVNYEKAINNFYSKFIDYKSRDKFEKAKDKERWLSKNISKTTFSSENDASETYKNLVNSKNALDNSIKIVQDIRNELLKKYDEKLIWDILQARIKSKRE